jgi:hypothetical protein
MTLSNMKAVYLSLIMPARAALFGTPEAFEPV